ncbi:MAG: TetR family transcriptional regulator [Syntrophorhabdales bacterium]
MGLRGKAKKYELLKLCSGSLNRRTNSTNMDKKELLARTAIDLFAKKGYANTSIRDIGKAAKVNVALIYYYFKDKEALLQHIIERSGRELAVILKEIQTTEPDPLECLKKMIVRQILHSSESWKETKLMAMEGDQLHGQARNESLRLQREIYGLYMTQLKRLKESNLLNDINLTVGNFVVFGMINWFYRWYKEGKPLDEKEIADEMIRILLFGFLKR